MLNVLLIAAVKTRSRLRAGSNDRRIKWFPCPVITHSVEDIPTSRSRQPVKRSKLYNLILMVFVRGFAPSSDFGNFGEAFNNQIKDALLKCYK